MSNHLQNITINGQPLKVAAGTTVLRAARQLGIEIPTMCYLDGLPHNTSCMVCMVEDKVSGRLLPACSAPIDDGMIIETDNERVRDFRRDALELLLSEHVGDCQAPCRRICPAFMNIPLMIRQIQQRDWPAAIRTVKAEIALPAVLGRICPAPCENGCTRRQHDAAVSICLLKRVVADIDLASDAPYRPVCAPDSGKKAAVVGAGPAGLSAAYYLRQFGHLVEIFEKQPQAGGNLRYAVSEEALPRNVLDAEIAQIAALGVRFHLSKELGKDVSLAQLTTQFDAVVLTSGAGSVDALGGLLEFSAKGVTVNRATLATSRAGVFACGNLVAESRMAVRAVGQGRTVAYSVDQFLRGVEVVGRPVRFNSIMGRLKEHEAGEFVKEAAPDARLEPSSAAGFSEQEAVAEALRCFHCDCRKPNSCKLRLYADEYGADQKKYRMGERLPFERQVQHELVVFEPGKCIKCGLCVQIAERAQEKFGMTFIRRGFNVKITVPFNEALAHGLEKVARECAEACPTAAIAMREREEAEV